MPSAAVQGEQELVELGRGDRVEARRSARRGRRARARARARARSRRASSCRPRAPPALASRSRPGRPGAACCAPRRRSRPAVSSVQVASGSATFSARVIEPNSAPDWNSTPQSGACEPSDGGAPSTRISPRIGSASPIRWRSSVDLPLPLPPRIAKISPRRTWKSMFSSKHAPSKPIASPDTWMCSVRSTRHRTPR